ncbi:cyclase [Allokutzneria sp. A3M-2-11 16]|uniref:cyclase n=1 Tax=Allokutzneria sp. A3M-2-11 16 TaxID=2962043 RepID=UPI0020B87D3D|nr:cyclase [Allokutzneria sp. A3M-2-11 16]MCP3801013.1 cyclase [Allokutzneria sp. A3M-2-11 16]
MSPARIALGGSLVTALALAPVLALATPASAASVTFACQAKTPIGPINASVTQAMEAKAPATVKPGAEFELVFDPPASTIPGTINGVKVREVKNFKLAVPVPANSTFISVALSGGVGVGTPTIVQEGGNMVVTLAGPLKGGAAIEIPTITVKLKAGASGTIESKLGGTSFDKPGLTFTGTAEFGPLPVDAPVACYPDPNPALTTTKIA